MSDGKGGKVLVKKEKPGGKKGKGGKGKPGAKTLEKQKKLEERWKDMGFSDESTDDDDVDLSKMTEEEKKIYFEEKAKRKAEREKRRREKYGDKYDEIMKDHEQFV